MNTFIKTFNKTITRPTKYWFCMSSIVTKFLNWTDPDYLTWNSKTVCQQELGSCGFSSRHSLADYWSTHQTQHQTSWTLNKVSHVISYRVHCLCSTNKTNLYKTMSTCNKLSISPCFKLCDNYFLTNL